MQLQRQNVLFLQVENIQVGIKCGWDKEKQWEEGILYIWNGSDRTQMKLLLTGSTSHCSFSLPLMN